MGRCGPSPQSLDLNITRLVRECNTRQLTSREDLWDVVQEVWRTIPADDFKKTRDREFTLFKINVVRPTVDFQAFKL